MADARSLLNRQRAEARKILRKLIDQPFQFEAYQDEMGQKGYRVTGQGSYVSLLPSPCVSPNVVPPTGSSNGDTQMFIFPIDLCVLTPS